MLKKCLIVLLAFLTSLIAAPVKSFARIFDAAPQEAAPGASLYINGSPSELSSFLLDDYHYARPDEVAMAFGSEFPLKTPANQDSTQYRKLREIAEELNLRIGWDGENKVVYLYTKNADEAVQAIAHDAYVYALPLVIMDLTIKNLTNVSDSNKSPINQFSHSREPATAEDKYVVRPNIDTPYSSACLDLSTEPLIFSKSKTDRYCSIAIYDAYTNCAAILGTGGVDNGEEASYLLCGPDYNGSVPDGYIKVSIPTNMAWMLVRTEYINQADLPNVHAIQNKLSLVPLSEAKNPNYQPPKGFYNPENDFVPLDKIKSMDIETFFNEFNKLAASNPGTENDAPALESFAQIGIGAGLTFNLADFSEQNQQILKDYPNSIIKELVGAYRTEGSRFSQIVNNWQYLNENIARFGTDYEFRAIVSLTGLGANPVEMAVYPTTAVDSHNELLNGENKYTIRFGNGQFPPCGAFWSITAYDKEGFLIENPINKYAIRGSDNFVKNQDGSVDIYIQSETPGRELQANWIPVSEDYFQLTLRIYLPEADVLDLSWAPPFVVEKQ